MSTKVTPIAIILLIVGLVADAGGIYVMDSNQISSLKAQIDGLQNDKANLQGQVTTLQNDKAGLEQQVSSLQAEEEGST